VDATPPGPRTPPPDTGRYGRLLARGRDADIFEYGTALVVRRARDGRSIAHEADVMEHVRRAGYPVPEVHEVRAGGTELVMDKVDGPSMLQAMLRRPWRQDAMAAMLAELHLRLGAIDAPPGLRQTPDGGSAVVHLDLHPLNVIMARSGPVVIDWANAGRGLPATDVAQTWVILWSSEAPSPPLLGRLLLRGRRRFVERFLDRTDMRDAADAVLPGVIERRLGNRTLSEGERQTLRRWLVSVGPSGTAG
jgi:aminoglycoside phosphotransferase (APT) family kinase protein